MNKILGLFLFLPVILLSQVDDPIHNFEAERRNINSTGMLILGGWAAANIISGSIGYYKSEKSTKYFHQFNAAWNVVNMAIAVFGYMQSSEVIPLGFSTVDAIKEYQFMQNLFLLNAGLDVAYIVTGLYLLEKSKSSEANKFRLKGYASSLFVQGGFLLAFDLIKYFIHQSNADINLYPALDLLDKSLSLNFNLRF